MDLIFIGITLALLTFSHLVLDLRVPFLIVNIIDSIAAVCIVASPEYRTCGQLSPKLEFKKKKNLTHELLSLPMYGIKVLGSWLIIKNDLYIFFNQNPRFDWGNFNTFDCSIHFFVIMTSSQL